jgi:hypothetical protein
VAAAWMIFGLVRHVLDRSTDEGSVRTDDGARDLKSEV